MSEQAPNPYAAPSAEAEQPTVRFSLDDEQRRIITQTATLMMVAGVVLLLPSLIKAYRIGISGQAVPWVASAIVAVFVAIAGFSLRSAASEGSLDALLSGFRQLHVAFLVKGVAALLLVGLFLLALLLMVLGVGLGFASLFG